MSEAEATPDTEMTDEEKAQAAADAEQAAKDLEEIQAEAEETEEAEEAKIPAYKSVTSAELEAGLKAAGKTVPKTKQERYDALYGMVNEPGEATTEMTARPSEYTVQDETHYKQVAEKFGYANYWELGAYNGVKNSRYDLVRGQVVKFPIKPLPGS